jgi:NAD/NADP transhydrogenase alpha subunit
MIVLIVKDSATQVPREVKSLEEAQAFANQGHEVLVQKDDGTKVPLAEMLRPNTAPYPVQTAAAASLAPKTVTRKKK